MASSPRSIGHLLRDRAVRSSGRPALRFGDQRLDFSEVERRTARMANRLAAAGVGPGDRVGIILPNGLEYPITWLGVVRAGAIVVPVNPGYRDADLSHVLGDSGARVLVTTTEHRPQIDAVRARVPALESVLAWDEGLAAELAAGSDRAPLGDLGPETLATLQYTSGTTGFPKGCMIPHGGWLQVAETFLGLGGFTERDVLAIMTPFYYGDFGWNLVLSLRVGAELVLLPRFSASTLWRTLGEVGATFFYCLGTMPILLLKQPPDPAVDRGHRVRWVSCSGIPAELHREIESRWGAPWREAYGTTEIGFVTATALGEVELVGSGSVGRMLPGYEGRLVGPDGAEVGPGETGELICRGPGMCFGYWNNPAATAAWRRDGWAHTGDLMRRDEEGHYYLVGRTKDMVRRGGENIAAAEVEAVLASHPAIRAAACVPVADEIRGEEVKAFLQPAGAVPDPEAVLAHCRERLAAFKVPRYLVFVTEFPLTPSQRIEKHKLPRGTAGCYDAVGKGWR